jgi:hypothetical protein
LSRAAEERSRLYTLDERQDLTIFAFKVDKRILQTIAGSL